MRSPPFVPKAIRQSPHQDDDNMSVTSFNSLSTASSRISRLPKRSSVAGGCTFGGETNVRVVARIRPVSVTSEKEGSRVVFPGEFSESSQRQSTDSSVADLTAKFNSPNTKPPMPSTAISSVFSPTKAGTHTRRQSSDSVGSVAGLTAKFNSPNNKPLMPSTDSCTASTIPTKLFSPSNAKTPIHTNSTGINKSKIVPVRQSFIQSPISTKALEKIVEKHAAANSRIFESISVGEETFKFDAVNDTCSTQEEVYNATVGDALRRNIFRGYNTTVMAYGQKDTGKSYTMYGPKMKKYGTTSMKNDDNASVKTSDSSFTYNTSHGSYDEDGIVPRAIHDLFLAKDKQATGGEVIIQMTFIEIYNDEIIDLLTSKSSKSKASKRLSIRDSTNDGNAGGVMIRGLTSIKLKSTSHARYILDAASKRKSSPSRSHTICTLHVKINPAVKSSITSGKMASLTSIDIVNAKLTLVDLAGSERTKVGSQLIGVKEKKENTVISKDLFVLGQCIHGVAENCENSDTSRKDKHIPFRDCKLTRILRDSLGGNCCTIVLACVAPCSKDVDGTLSTLRQAEENRKIINNVKKNMTKTHALTQAEGAALRKENKVLKSHVLDMTRKMQTFRRGTQNNAVVFDLGGLDQVPKEESLETKRWRLQFEKVLQLCREANINIGGADKLTNDDEGMLMRHSLEVQELKEQINQLMNCQLQDCGSLTSGLTMDDDFDDQSIASTVKSFESLLHISAAARSKEDIETSKELEIQEEKLANQIKEMETKRAKLVDQVGVEAKKDEELKERIATKENTLIFLNAEILQAEKRVSSLKKEEKKLKIKVEDARELIDFSDETIQGKVAECDRISAHIVSLKDQVKSLSDEKIALVEEVDDYQNTSDLLSELNSEKEAMAETQKNLQSATKEVESLNSNIDEFKSKCKTLEAASETEKQKRLDAENRIQELESRVKELTENGGKNKDVCTRQDMESSNLETRVSQLENLIKLQQTEGLGKQHHTSKRVLRDHSNELSKPPLAKKRKGSSTRAFGDSSKSLSLVDDRSVVSAVSMSRVLKDSTPLGKEKSFPSILFNEDGQKDNSSDFNASFDNESLMSGAFSVGSASLTSDQRAIRVHAQKLLLWADKTVEIEGNKTDFQHNKENMGNAATGAFPSFRTPDKKPYQRSSADSFKSCTRDGNSTFTKCTRSTEGCTCKNSIFSGNKEHSEFFLPRLGLACKCGAEKKRKKSDDPTALKSFLRSWQVSYLKSLGVRSASDLIAQHEHESQQMARAMKHWRYSKRMKPARTKSCLVALRIWSKTAKSVLRAHQKNQRVIQRSNQPNKSFFLEIEADDEDNVSIMSMDEFENDALLDGEYEV